jgi:hypothetical protein
MSQTKFQRADAVAAKLSKEIGSPRWLRGIAVVPHEQEGFVVSVRVAGGARIPPLAERIDGIMVCVETRRLARASGE